MTLARDRGYRVGRLARDLSAEIGGRDDHRWLSQIMNPYLRQESMIVSAGASAVGRLVHPRPPRPAPGSGRRWLLRTSLEAYALAAVDDETDVMLEMSLPYE